MRLTPEQKRIMLTLCDASEGSPGYKWVKLVCQTGTTTGPIRETTTGTALVRKGLAERSEKGSFRCTAEGFWLGDGLRIEDRQGHIPARRS